MGVGGAGAGQMNWYLTPKTDTPGHRLGVGGRVEDFPTSDFWAQCYA